MARKGLHKEFTLEPGDGTVHGVLTQKLVVCPTTYQLHCCGPVSRSVTEFSSSKSQQ